MLDYNSVTPVSPEKFAAAMPPLSELNDPSLYTASDDDDFVKMERLLDLRDGALGRDGYYLEHRECECGRLLTMYDFVFTALVDAGHSKSLIVHTFVGNKLVLNPPRPIRCSNCARILPDCKYAMPNSYSCESIVQ